MGKAASILGKYLKDQELTEIARGQLYWTLGKESVYGIFDIRRGKLLWKTVHGAPWGNHRSHASRSPDQGKRRSTLFPASSSGHLPGSMDHPARKVDVDCSRSDQINRDRIKDGTVS